MGQKKSNVLQFGMEGVVVKQIEAGSGKLFQTRNFFETRGICEQHSLSVIPFGICMAFWRGEPIPSLKITDIGVASFNQSDMIAGFVVDTHVSTYGVHC